MLRTGHKGLAAATLLLDVAKGAAAVLLAEAVSRPASPCFPGSARFSAISIRSGSSFKGGKGVATLIGIVAALHWPTALVDGAVWLGLLALTRYSSLAGIIAPLSRAGRGRLFGRFDLAMLFLGFALLVLWKHRDNIDRLLAGTEPKVGGASGLNDALATFARLRLIRSDNIGPVTYFQLLARFGSAQAALDALPDLAARGGGRAPSWRRGRVEREIERVAEARRALSVPRPGPLSRCSPSWRRRRRR